MGTTTKMAIPYPEATGLVKDGWEDMKDIATQVDAKTGLVLINTTTFTTVASVQLDNIFTSDYDFYKININVTNTSTDLNLRMRVVDGTTPITTNTYNWAMPGLRVSGLEWNQYGTDTAFFLNSCETASQPFAATEMTVYSPLLAKNTTFTWVNAGVSQAGTVHGTAGGGIQGSDQSIEGVQFLTSTGTMSGTVSVFGYNK